MKKVFAFILCLVISSFAIPAHAEVNFSSSLESKPTIAVLIGGQGAIRSNEKAIKIIYDKLNEKFPNKAYNLVTDSKLSQDVLIFTEDEEVTDISQIKKGQLAKFGKERNFDYIICLVLGMGYGRAGIDFWSAKYNIDVDMQAKVVDVSTGQYIYRQNIMGHGTSSAALGMPSSVNAFAKATQKCMEQFVKDITISPIKPTPTEDK
ncbi:hypothetical protein [Sporomusa acidovorans]|uniref:Uncharacterized protein n=1 Tax=Sporomusa acidovorans (strain ATCC 49682 / DSM 3132 / Mol) TaxID=1123286 RepID=A0ABZ3IZ09_SPOA4|nr:hypothetical protein [Sporomusa acidovorans]OZC22077.1 hypothetical protein SPACI_15950 [Sporomusa acidovorans DSM 3132]SDF65849.1 hypothetical protein SAMN04488499_10662 [Sporomusa acidovorans]